MEIRFEPKLSCVSKCGSFNVELEAYTLLAVKPRAAKKLKKKLRVEFLFLSNYWEILDVKLTECYMF